MPIEFEAKVLDVEPGALGMHDGIDGLTETEVVVGDFETASELLVRFGFEAKSYQENRRESFELAGARLEIDGRGFRCTWRSKGIRVSMSSTSRGYWGFPRSG